MNLEVLYDLYGLLWQDYTTRVSYARIYRQMITAVGNQLNSHLLDLGSALIDINFPNMPSL